MGLDRSRIFVTDYFKHVTLRGMVKFGGQIRATSWDDAHYRCYLRRRGEVPIGVLVSEIPADETSYEADWDNQVDYPGGELI